MPGTPLRPLPTPSPNSSSLPKSYARAASLNTSFPAAGPASGSPADGKPDPDPDTDANDSDPDDHAQPKPGPGAPARAPLSDADLLAALRSDALRVEVLRLHLEDRGLPTVGLKGVLVGRLFEHLLAPPSPSPVVRPAGGAPTTARSIADSLALLDQASSLTNRLAAGASAYPRLLAVLYPDAAASSGTPSPDARFLHGLVVREVNAYLNKQLRLLYALQVAAQVRPGERSALAHALSATGLETAALALFSGQPPTRSEHPPMAVTRCLPLAVIGLALLRKSFVPGSNPASARLLAKLSCLSFDRGGEVELAVHVGDIQAALSDCRQRGVTGDWDLACRLLIAALSEAGSLRLELPSDGQTLSWSALARTHAGKVLGLGPTSPFPAEAVESLLGELTEFARAQSFSELTFANARCSLRGLPLESVNRVGPSGASSGGESRRKLELT